MTNAAKTEATETHNYRAYDLVTGWSGPPRATVEQAERDASRHNSGCARQGGYGRAVVAQRDPEADGRLAHLDGETIWPPHGRTTGAARWL